MIVKHYKTEPIVKVILLLLALVNDYQVKSQDSTNQNFDNFRASVLAFQPESYIVPFGGFGNIEPLLFEAQLSGTFFIRFRENSRWAMDLSPAIMVRMLNEESYPIPTPSYIPRASLYFNTGRKNRFADDRLYLFFTLVHHSNGQDGSFYTEEGTINQTNGNFSTNYFQLGLFSLEQSSALPSCRRGYKFSLEYHFEQESGLKYKYGKWQLNQEVEAMLFEPFRLSDLFGQPSEFNRKCCDSKPRSRINIKTSLILDYLENSDFSDHIILTATYTYRPKFSDGISLFVRYHYGRDYYNIQFERKLSLLSIGLRADSFDLNRKK